MTICKRHFYVIVDISWFTDSYLKGDNGKYCAWYAITTPFDVVEAASLTMAISAQQDETYDFTRACTLAKDKSVNIYTDSKYAFGVAHNFEMLW